MPARPNSALWLCQGGCEPRGTPPPTGGDGPVPTSLALTPSPLAPARPRSATSEQAVAAPRVLLPAGSRSVPAAGAEASGGSRRRTTRRAGAHWAGCGPRSPLGVGGGGTGATTGERRCLARCDGGSVVTAPAPPRRGPRRALRLPRRSAPPWAGPRAGYGAGLRLRSRAAAGGERAPPWRRTRSWRGEGRGVRLTVCRSPRPWRGLSAEQGPVLRPALQGPGSVGPGPPKMGPRGLRDRARVGGLRGPVRAAGARRCVSVCSGAGCGPGKAPLGAGPRFWEQ